MHAVNDDTIAAKNAYLPVAKPTVMLAMDHMAIPRPRPIISMIRTVRELPMAHSAPPSMARG